MTHSDSNGNGHAQLTRGSATSADMQVSAGASVALELTANSQLNSATGQDGANERADNADAVTLCDRYEVTDDEIRTRYGGLIAEFSELLTLDTSEVTAIIRVAQRKGQTKAGQQLLAEIQARNGQ